MCTFVRVFLLPPSSEGRKEVKSVICHLKMHSIIPNKVVSYIIMCYKHSRNTGRGKKKLSLINLWIDGSGLARTDCKLGALALHMQLVEKMTNREQDRYAKSVCVCVCARICITCACVRACMQPCMGSLNAY